MYSSLPFARIALIAGLLVLGLSACGRRGPLEAPPDPTAPQAQISAEEGDQQGTIPSPVGTPSRRAKQGYVIPKEPFILDPLL